MARRQTLLHVRGTKGWEVEESSRKLILTLHTTDRASKANYNETQERYALLVKL